MRMRRSDCIAWWVKKGLPIPPRSSCVGCPYRRNNEWEWLKENSPEDFKDAVFFDNAIRKCGGMRGDVFIHEERVPLDQVEFNKNKKQLTLF